MMAGALAAIWKLFTEDGGTETQETCPWKTLWSCPTHWAALVIVSERNFYLVYIVITWRFSVMCKLNLSYVLLTYSGKT